MRITMRGCFRSHFVLLLFLVVSELETMLALVAPAAKELQIPQPQPQQQHQVQQPTWMTAVRELAQPNCCVVTVKGLQSQLGTLQQWMELTPCVPADLDLRMRVRTTQGQDCLFDDCNKLQRLVQGGKEEEAPTPSDITLALAEIAQGVASFNGNAMDVFVRIVTASVYKARDPMFHTDKCPLRAYVTLKGVGTEIMTRIASPVEYASLRGFGKLPNAADSLRQAHELEFIVMKGDNYQHDQSPIFSNIWKRALACVHRSPPGNGGRRIILSLDLADGGDDQEWHTVRKKREWRSGMTQRKSRLVA